MTPMANRRRGAFSRPRDWAVALQLVQLSHSCGSGGAHGSRGCQARVQAVEKGAEAVLLDVWPVAETEVGNPAGGADCGTVTVCTNLPDESEVTVPTVVTWTRISTSSPGLKPLPLTVRLAPLGAVALDSVISAEANGSKLGAVTGLKPGPPPG